MSSCRNPEIGSRATSNRIISRTHLIMESIKKNDPNLVYSSTSGLIRFFFFSSFSDWLSLHTFHLDAKVQFPFPLQCPRARTPPCTTRTPPCARPPWKSAPPRRPAGSTPRQTLQNVAPQESSVSFSGSWNRCTPLVDTGGEGCVRGRTLLCAQPVVRSLTFGVPCAAVFLLRPLFLICALRSTLRADVCDLLAMAWSFGQLRASPHTRRLGSYHTPSCLSPFTDPHTRSFLPPPSSPLTPPPPPPPPRPRATTDHSLAPAHLRLAVPVHTPAHLPHRYW